MKSSGLVRAFKSFQNKYQKFRVLLCADTDFGGVLNRHGIAFRQCFARCVNFAVDDVNQTPAPSGDGSDKERPASNLPK